MVRINFNLRSPKSENKTPINAIIRWKGNRLVYPTNISILPKYWDDRKQVVKNVTGIKNHHRMNSVLIELKDLIELAYLNLSPTVKSVDVLSFRNELNRLSGKGRGGGEDLFEFISDFISNSSGRITDKGVEISPRTIQRYNTTLGVLKKYKDDRKVQLLFKSLNFDFFSDFRKFLAEQMYSPNTMAKHTETLKSFIRAAYQSGYQVNKDFMLPGTGTTRVQPFDIYLSNDDLKLLSNVKLTSAQDAVRDYMLLSCYTGLRYSDWDKICRNIKGNFIEIIQFKTKEKVIIPVHKEVKQILTKYNGALPELISNQKFNISIKKVCELAGISYQITFNENKGGKITTVTQPKFQLVSAHTGRRTFATHQYLKGIPAQTIMKITGHKSIKTFMLYLKLDESEHAEIMAKTWEHS